MSVLGPHRKFLEAVANLGYCNPFLPERVELERAALGSDFTGAGPVWSVSLSHPDVTRPNVTRLHQKLPAVIEEIRAKLDAGASATDEERTIYEESVHCLLYQRYYDHFVAARDNYRFYRSFLEDWNRLCPRDLEPAHVFACFRQIQRAFHHIYDNIIGNSMPAAMLRASIWQSIFTHDLRRYRRILYRKMAEFPTLITGPSGTGKELIARAIAGSRYVPFDPVRMEFLDVRGETFLPINIAALTP